MYDIFATEQFRSDLDGFDKALRERVPKTIRLISENPFHSSLGTEKQITIRGRTIMRSRVNQKYRLLWEWLVNGGIGLWRVGNHEFIDAFTSLPGSNEAHWEPVSDRSETVMETVPDWRTDLHQPQPFRLFPANHLRLFGVPDEFVDTVQTLCDPEAIWDMPIPENVQFTLYDILLKGSDWTADSFLDTKQLLYRTTVDQLEGYCEGKIKRLLLNLTDEQMALVKVSATGPILIKGVAGSGKTTIGLYRAYYLAQLLEQQRMSNEKTSLLFLTFSSTLARALRQLYVELHGNLSKNIKIDTYSRWMLQQLFPDNQNYPITEKNDRFISVRQAQKEIIGRVPENNFIKGTKLDFLLDEIDNVIRARGLNSLEEYQLVNRAGRSLGLDRERHRPLIWQVYESYQRQLDGKGLVDFADLPRLTLQKRDLLPKYDAVIIDEAQDLPPIYLRLATQLITDYEQSRGLTLLADPAQSIYYRGITWKEGGINVRGNRTRTLVKNFRNTQQILEAAKGILEGCDDLKSEDEYIPPTSTYRLGPKPVLMQYEDPVQELQFIADTMVKLCQGGQYRAGDIAVLARNELSFPAIKKFLSKEDIPWTYFRDKDFEILENQVKLISMHSAKGLEFPVVFLIDLREGSIPYISSQENEEADLAQERKLFYVSMTRASERLYLLYPKHNRCRFVRDLAPTTVTYVH